MKSFRLELPDGTVTEPHSIEEVLKEVKDLNFKSNQVLNLQRGIKSKIRIEVNAFNRFHIYKHEIGKIKQTLHPLPKNILIKVVTLYLEGKLNWDKGIRYVEAESEVYIQLVKEEEIREVSDSELKERTKRTFLLVLGKLLISILLFFYMYSKWDTTIDMNSESFFYIMITMIGSFVFSIYTAFDLLEQVKELKKRKG